MAAALGATSTGFALSHRHQGRGGAVHFVTGGVFGVTFVCAGLAAAIAAHASYNVLVDLGVLAEREPGVDGGRAAPGDEALWRDGGARRVDLAIGEGEVSR